MHVTDICSIFGNALDNAIEHVSLIPDPEKRLIHLTVSAQKGFVFIKIENYCEAEISKNEEDLITTTKKYSLQGTTQGRYLTGGVPPVRFSM